MWTLTVLFSCTKCRQFEVLKACVLEFVQPVKELLISEQFLFSSFVVFTMKTQIPSPDMFSLETDISFLLVLHLLLSIVHN